MSSLITFRKEFEDFVLKGKLDEALKTLVPNSKEKIYLQFCEEFKKCFAKKEITKELESIITNAKKNNIPNTLIRIFETKRDLLEYDLPSTNKEKKEQIIEQLYKNYCGINFHYNAPFFVREKKSGKEGGQNEVNKTPLELTEKMIKNEIDKQLKQNERDQNFKFVNAPKKKKIQILMDYIDNNMDRAIHIIESRVQIPFYLMTKEQFTKIINVFNGLKKDLNRAYYNIFTIEQIERLLKEVNNEMYINREILLTNLMEKKYNKLIRKLLKKNDLDEVKKLLWEVYEVYKTYSPKFMAGTLLYILKINKLKNLLEVKPFIEYVKNPIIDRRLYEQRKFYLNDIKNDTTYSLISLPSLYFEDISSHKFIEDLLIDFFLYEKAKPEDFKDYFKHDYLKKLEYIAKMYKGEEVKADEYSKYLTNPEYEELVKKIELTICEHNPKEFRIEEEVKIEFDFKNTKSINVSIYEINTENYYLIKKTPLNSLINVEGVIASKTFDVKIEGGENPLKRIRKIIDFKEIPKDKRGVYLIEILGNGMSTRIIIKKGKLNLVTRTTAKGILCQMINEKNEVLKDSKTYLWYNGIKYTCGEKDGFIALPYKVLVDPTNKCILVHDSYADITEIKRKSEKFILKGYFNILNESIIPGNMLKVSFKPLLFANGRETSLEQIKNGIITVKMEKEESRESIPVTTTFDNLEFKDDNKEYEFEVLIPPMMKSMIFKFECQIITNTKGDKINLNYEQNSNFTSCNNQISMPLFHKVGKKYVYEHLGRNGENITTNAGTNENVGINTYTYPREINIQLQYDKLGKLNLGELKEVRYIIIRGKKYFIGDYSKYCYPERVDIIPGECFTLPLYTNKKISLDDNYFLLYQYFIEKEVPTVVCDVKNEIILKELDINGDKEHYYEFTTGHNLKKGKYCLVFGEDNSETYIIIKVKEGTHWMNYENYIINDNGYVENSEIKTPVYMKNLSIDKEKGEIKFECSKTRRNIKYTHANIYLFQYQNPGNNTFFNKYYKMLNDDVENIVSTKFSQWKNIYLSNRILNEEIQYALQRRNLENQLGNSLPIPSLLLKRAYKKDCENEEEKLEKGNEYKKIEEDIDYSRESNFLNRRIEKEQKLVNTDFYYFLQNPGYVINNIEPININSNDNYAKFEIKFGEKEKDILKKYSYIYIVLIDNKSISTNYHCLCEDNDKFEIEKRNISLEKALDNNKNLSEIKKTELFKKGEEFKINETSSYKFVDSIEKLCMFYIQTLKSYNDTLNKFEFVLNLNEKEFDEEQFLKNYNEVCGHEINLFLYFKFPKLFDKYVKNILKYKFEKTFIDYFLLDDYESLLQYLTPLKIKNLRTDELCLFILKLVDKNPKEAEKIRDIIKSRVKKSDEAENILLTNFNIMMNMRVEEDKDLEEIKKSPKEISEDSDEFKNSTNYGFRGILCKRRFMGFSEDSLEPNFYNNNYTNNNPYGPVSNNKIESSLEQTDFLAQERTKHFDTAYRNAQKDMGEEFEKPRIAKEYKERHYYLKDHKNSNVENPLWLDFAEHIILYKKHDNFISKYVLYNNIDCNEFFLILSIIGLPIKSLNHEYKRIPNTRLISIITASNLILFTKELINTPLNLNNKLLISQNVIDESHNDMNINTNNCTTGITYSHQSIVTNISNKSIVFQLFIQIPQGSICLKDTYYTNSIKLKLNPYETKNHKTYFYFPKEGKFTQYHPVACENSNIISAGTFLTYEVKKEYTPSKKKEIIENDKYSKDMRVEGKLINILSDDSVNLKDKLIKIINYFTYDIFNEVDINNVLYLLKDNKDFYYEFIKTLRKRGFYHHNVWSFCFHHRDEMAIKEYLSTNIDIINDLGYDFKSNLYSYNDSDDSKIYPHLEYNPLHNARKHPFGNKDDKNLINIENKEFKETYCKYIVDLLSLHQLTIKEKLRLVYYLILQDRMDDALDIFEKIKKDEIDNCKNRNYKIQYDYINAYLDFCFGYPDFKISKSICTKYKDFPLSYWAERFEEIEDQLLEYEGKEKVSMDMISSENDKNSQKLSKELREKEPKLSFTIDSKNGKIFLLHSNISEIDIKFYLIDLETMFTRDPRISEIMDKDRNKENNSKNGIKEHFGYVQHNYAETIKIDREKINKNESSTFYDIPQKYKNKNLFVEVKAESFKLFDLYLSSNLYVIITESLGELKVVDSNFKPVIKAYVKVYVELNNNEVQFYKDGYSDLNGKFNYLELNTDQLKNSKKFYIFVSEEKQGAIIKECYPPKIIEKNAFRQDGKDDILEDVQKYRQSQRNRWRFLNK